MIVLFLMFSLWGIEMDQAHSEPIKPGTYVKANDPVHEEYGIVISCWYEQEIRDFDCYVAFFGDAFPVGDAFPNEKPNPKPYVLRYSVTSLIPIDDPYAAKQEAPG